MLNSSLMNSLNENSHQCANIETSSIITDNNPLQKSYAISRLSKQTRNNNIVLNDAMNTFRSIDKAKRDKKLKLLDNKTFENNKLELKNEILRL